MRVPVSWGFTFEPLALVLSLWRLFSCDFERSCAPAQRWRFCCSLEWLGLRLRHRRRWSIEGDVGWDVPVSGNILSAAIGLAIPWATIINSKWQVRDLTEMGSSGVGYKIIGCGELRDSLMSNCGSPNLKQIGTAANSGAFAAVPICFRSALTDWNVSEPRTSLRSSSR